MNARELAAEILRVTAGCRHAEPCDCQTQVFAALEGYRTQILYRCRYAISYVKEPVGPMPPENIEAHNKHPELAVRVVIRMTKQEAVENIDKIDWEKS
jgi:hypothetical protein